MEGHRPNSNADQKSDSGAVELIPNRVTEVPANSAGTGAQVLPQASVRTKSSQFRRLARILATVVSLAAALRYSAFILVADSPSNAADAVIVGDWRCGQCYPVVCNKMKSGNARTVLLVTRERKRVVVLGAVLPAEELCRTKLVRDGVEQDAIRLLDGTSDSDFETGRLIEGWLIAHPEKRINLLCDHFSSRTWSYILDRTISPSKRILVSVEGVADPRYNELNWWRSRVGLKSFFGNLFHQGYVRLHGEDRHQSVDWSPDAYEMAVLQ